MSVRKGLDVMVGFSNSFKLLDHEATVFEHSSKLQVGIGASDCMHDPFDLVQRPRPKIPRLCMRSSLCFVDGFLRIRDTLRTMQETFFKLNARPIASEAWGDYGDILQHGMTAHSPRVNGNLSLERTGPYIPPVTLPGLGDVVLTDAARRLLETSGLTGFTFRPVEKKQIVDSPWHTWNLTAEEPAEYPDSGEPEGYILKKPHSPALAIEMGDLWEVVVPFSVVIVRPTRIVNSYRDLHIDLATWDGTDMLRGKGYSGMLFSQRAKDWFVEQWDRYLYFDQFSAA